MNLILNANTTQRSQKMVSSRFWILAFSAISLSLATLPAVANPFDDDDDDIDDDEVVSGEYTCNPRLDYSGANTCKTIQNGICDNPNHGEGAEKTVSNKIASTATTFEFDADCFGCLNAVGCYYCPIDASCRNSDEYALTDKTKVTCTVYEDYWLGGRDDPDKLCISSDSPTQDSQSTSNPTSAPTIANNPTVKRNISSDSPTQDSQSTSNPTSAPTIANNPTVKKKIKKKQKWDKKGKKLDKKYRKTPVLNEVTSNPTSAPTIADNPTAARTENSTSTTKSIKKESNKHQKSDKKEKKSVRQEISETIFFTIFFLFFSLPRSTVATFYKNGQNQAI